MAIKSGMFKQAHRDRASYRKVTAAGVLWIRAKREEGLTIAAIRDAFKEETGTTLGHTTIGDILSRLNHGDVS